MGELTIETVALTRRFGSTCVVDRLELHVPAQSVYGFLGQNGAGKTTTIRMLLGLIRPSSGAIRIGGLGMPDQRRAVLRQVGALVETPSLYPNLSGVENLTLTQRVLGIERGHIQRVLAIVRLERDARRLVKTYSLGMQQRLALALALLAQPRVLILDEPTNGLDPAGIQEMRALIAALAHEHGITVFLSSHLLSEVEQVATHVGILHQGRLLFQGPLTELAAQQRAFIEIEVEQPAEARRLLLGAGYQADPGQARLVRVAVQPGVSGPHINRLLVEHGIAVHRLVRASLSLEDVFLELTHSLATERGL